MKVNKLYVSGSWTLCLLIHLDCSWWSWRACLNWFFCDFPGSSSLGYRLGHVDCLGWFLIRAASIHFTITIARDLETLLGAGDCSIWELVCVSDQYRVRNVLCLTLDTSLPADSVHLGCYKPVVHFHLRGLIEPLSSHLLVHFLVFCILFSQVCHFYFLGWHLGSQR